MYYPLTEMRGLRLQVISLPKVTCTEEALRGPIPRLRPKERSLTPSHPAQPSQALVPEGRPTASLPRGVRAHTGTGQHLAWGWEGAQRGARGLLLVQPIIPTGGCAPQGRAGCLFL